MRPKSLFPLCDIAHMTIFRAIQNTLPSLANATVVDATCGNGHDSLFLAQTCQKIAPDAKVRLLGFDVQAVAITNTLQQLTPFMPTMNIDLLHEGHEKLGHYLNKEEKNLAVTYNLGFLPKSDKTIITQAKTTIPSLEAATTALTPNGIISIHAYGGHPGGDEELTEIATWCSALPRDTWLVRRYETANKVHKPEILFLLEKL